MREVEAEVLRKQRHMRAEFDVAAALMTRTPEASIHAFTGMGATLFVTMLKNLDTEDWCVTPREPLSAWLC
jgi:hypothetical protein